MRFRSMLSGSLLVLAIGVSGVPACNAQQSVGEQSPVQQAEELKKQLVQLRKQYEMTTYQLGQRIAALEEQLDKQEPVQQLRWLA